VDLLQSPRKTFFHGAAEQLVIMTYGL